MEIQILKYPHPTLRHKSKPVTRIDRQLKKWVEEMFELMYATEGIGLASNQVDLPYQLFVLNVTGDRTKTEEERVILNPVIHRRKESAEDLEGCLSFPGITANVVRPAIIEFEGIALNGETQIFKFDGLIARAVQHEMDHLNGCCFVDRLTPSELATIRPELDELTSEYESKCRLWFIPSEKEVLERLVALEKERSR